MELAMSYPVRPRHELAFWSTLSRMAEMASYQAPSRPGADDAFKLVAECAAEKQKFWEAVTAPPPKRYITSATWG